MTRLDHSMMPLRHGGTRITKVAARARTIQKLRGSIDWLFRLVYWRGIEKIKKRL